MSLRCWFLDGLNTDHPEPIEFYVEHGKAFCKPCERFYATQKAKRAHPVGKALPPLPEPDMSRCLHHDMDDRWGCPVCIDNRETAVFLND